MNTQEKEIVKNQINFVTQKMTRGDISHLIAYFFETSKLPEIVAIERGEIHIDGFAKLEKRIFKFEMIFWQKDYSTELKLKLKYGKTKLEKWTNIEIKQKENELAIYLEETKQYLFSVYS